MVAAAEGIADLRQAVLRSVPSTTPSPPDRGRASERERRFDKKVPQAQLIEVGHGLLDVRYGDRLRVHGQQIAQRLLRELQRDRTARKLRVPPAYSGRPRGRRTFERMRLAIK